MGEDQYILSHTADVSERERLGLMEHLHDARSQRYLTALSIQKGWRCLEVGAGQGSIARCMVEALRLGGWLLIEDIDVPSLRAVEATHPLAESFDRQYREVLDRIAQARLFHLDMGRRVRGLLEDAGLTAIDNEGVSRIARGGEAEARMMCMTLQAWMERGILSAAEYTDLQSAFLDPSFSFIMRTTFAAWGKRVS